MAPIDRSLEPSETTKGNATKRQYAVTAAIATGLLASQPIHAAAPSAFGSGFDVQDFYQLFSVEDITPKNQQKWPYYKHVSVRWDDYALHGTERVGPSKNPVKLEVIQGRLNLNTEYKNGMSFIDSFVETQVKRASSS